MASH
jgi:hypothetical protein